jgi:hypothetical protein
MAISTNGKPFSYQGLRLVMIIDISNRHRPLVVFIETKLNRLYHNGLMDDEMKKKTVNYLGKSLEPW